MGGFFLSKALDAIAPELPDFSSQLAAHRSLPMPHSSYLFLHLRHAHKTFDCLFGCP